LRYKPGPSAIIVKKKERSALSFRPVVESDAGGETIIASPQRTVVWRTFETTLRLRSVGAFKRAYEDGSEFSHRIRLLSPYFRHSSALKRCLES
jgi:hypothetical protein